MEPLARFVLIFVLGAAEIFIAIPVGLELKLNPVLVGIIGALGGIAGVIAIGLLGGSSLPVNS